MNKSQKELIIGFICGVVVSSCIFDIYIKEHEKQPEIKPCNCINYSQYALWSEKYNRYVSENKPDSVAKYAELLNQIK